MVAGEVVVQLRIQLFRTVKILLFEEDFTGLQLPFQRFFVVSLYHIGVEILHFGGVVVYGRVVVYGLFHDEGRIAKRTVRCL